MKARRLTFAGALLFAGLCPLLQAQNAETVFTSGTVGHKNAAGKTVSLEIGDLVRTGESVITKSDGNAELQLTTGKSSIKVKPNSVFMLTERSVGGVKQTVLQAAAGSVSMKFEKLAGKEPLVGSSNCVAGVRGTEVTIYAGMDGSTLMAVSSGAVELESGGSTVSLSANEAVEVKPGQAPGQKFAWLGKEVDYSKWNEGKLADFLADPAGSARKVREQMAGYRDSMLALLPELEKKKADFAAAAAELKRLSDAKDQRSEDYRAGTVFPLIQDQATLFLNIRYYALSVLSMRRFVLGDMYMQMRSRHMLDPGNQQYSDFLGVYADIVTAYEASIVPQLVDADI